MLNGIKYVRKGLSEILFPSVCSVCGHALSSAEAHVCNFCIRNKFELASSGNATTSDVILPEGIEVQYALWNFDKGGYLQDLLHDLKYNRLTGIGTDMGKALANQFRKHHTVDPGSTILLPVPLHPAKFRKRGYNQAFYIALGMKKIMGIPIVKPADVIRIKNTKTQTGFSLEKRRENINKAFEIRNPEAITGKTCIIVDDVFTTGATTFELAGELINVGAGKIMITTVAQA